MMINATLTLQKNPDGLSLPNPAPSSKTAQQFPSASSRFLAFLFVKTHDNVQIGTAACVARPPAQCACRKALPDHRATTQDFEELEELGGAMDARRWFDLLLQHFQCLRRRARLYVFPRSQLRRAFEQVDKNLG